ncbi:hypothetical protein A4X17_05955 [Plantibacter sp. H53]|uniref:hypothetical protein n=1 Tax=Plantibacter sp. H53 TaxID=1827323 RepID=UPI0007DA25B5|nr:hypothetical protein [Plantibacter sp. H53]OAN29117.1 hypothetical protein A4X17_05955 [Plantibacter sp. H53]
MAAQVLAPRAGQLELHLDGRSVEDHATNAVAFGTFVTKVAQAAQEYVRDRLGRTAARDVLIAPGPGSVRATFIAPDPVDVAQNPFADQQQDGPVWVDGNLQSEALHRFALLFAHSNPETPDSDVLDGAIQSIPLSARRKLRVAVHEVFKQEWSVSGEYRQRGIGVEEVVLQPIAAKYLWDRLKVEQMDEEPWVSSGILDGHKWSTGIMYFIPDGRSRPIPSSFASTEIQQQVAALAAEPEQRVEATFTVFIQHDSASSNSGRRSYLLRSIRPLDAGPAATLL